MRAWVFRFVSVLVLIPLLAAGYWWAGLNCETRAVTPPFAGVTPNAPRTWTDFQIPNLARIVIVDPGWDSSVVEVEQILWAGEPDQRGPTIPGQGTSVEVQNPIRHRGCAPDRGDRFVVSLAQMDGIASGPWLRIHPDGSLTVEGGIDPELDQRVFAAGAVDGVLDSDALVAFAADLAMIDRSTVQVRMEAGEPFDRLDGATQGPMDAAMVENLAVLAERGQSPNW